MQGNKSSQAVLNRAMAAVLALPYNRPEMAGSAKV
jgi:hypothetical protein